MLSVCKKMADDNNTCGSLAVVAQMTFLFSIYASNGRIVTAKITFITHAGCITAGVG